MVNISRAARIRIDAQVKEKEHNCLVDFLLTNDDENIDEALRQALAVVKLIFSEEIEVVLKKYRDSLIQQEEEAIERKKAEKAKLAARNKKYERELEWDKWEQIEEFKNYNKFKDDYKAWTKNDMWMITNTLDEYSNNLWKSYKKNKKMK